MAIVRTQYSGYGFSISDVGAAFTSIGGDIGSVVKAGNQVINAVTGGSTPAVSPAAGGAGTANGDPSTTVNQVGPMVPGGSTASSSQTTYLILAGLAAVGIIVYKKKMKRG